MQDKGGLLFTADGPKMVPLEGVKLSDIVLKALNNIDHLDFLQFEVWRRDQSKAIQDLSRSRPPAHLYRVTGGPLSQATKDPIYGIVVGYSDGDKQLPAGVVVKILGMPDDMSEFVVAPTILEEVTEAARQNELDYGSLG
jgi:hypothetical protein